MRGNNNYPKIIRDFLENPRNRSAFDAFFKLCHDYVKACLYRRKHLGHDLRLEDRDETKAIADRAYDILGVFLGSKSGEPFFHVFDCFKKPGLYSLLDTPDQDLYYQFKGCLGKFIGQELAKIKSEGNPQIQNLKRRFRNIFKDKRFCIQDRAKKGHEKICLCDHAHNLREDKPAIPYDELYELAEKAYFDSNTRVEWCNNIFELLNEAKEYQNQVVMYELISIVVSINARHVDLYGLRPSAMPSARDASIRDAIDNARKRTILWLKNEVLPGFVEKGRIDRDEAERFAKAAELFLIDLGYDGWTDPIPDYFRAFMPEEKHKPYLDDYKYVFETVIEKAKEYFKDILGNDPTIGIFGDY